MDAGVVAGAVGGFDVVVAVTFRLPQGLRGVALSQQFAVDQPQVGRVVAVGLQGDGLTPVFDDGAIHRRGDAQDGRGRRRAGVAFGVPGSFRRGVAAWRVGQEADDLPHDGDEGIDAGALVAVAAVGAACPEQHGVVAGVGDCPQVAPAVGGAGFQGDGLGAIGERAPAVADFLQDLAGLQAGALAGKRRRQFGAVGAVGEFAVEAGEVGGADADTAEGQGEVGRAVVEGGERQAVFFEPARQGIGTDAG